MNTLTKSGSKSTQTICFMTPEQNPDSLALTLLIPVRNEGVNIKIMLKVLNGVIEVPHEVLFVYDHPEDNSIEIVNNLKDQFPNTRLIHNQSGMGVVNALRAGVNAAKGEYILVFAADEVGPVLAIDDMLDLMNKGCDLVSCTRYAHGGRRLGGSKIGHMLSWLANKMFLYLFDSALSDCTTGIKMFRKSLFNEIKLDSSPVGWAVAFELSIKAQLQGYKLGEVPIVSIDRLFGGESTFKLGPWFVEYLKWFIWGLKNLRKGKSQKSAPAKVSLPNYYVH
jgi:dolichol-phosphate mannosyltransferase